MRELFEQPDKVLKNALREGLIRCAQAQGETMTKHQAREIVGSIITDEAVLSSFFAYLNIHQIKQLYRALAERRSGNHGADPEFNRLLQKWDKGNNFE